MHRTPSRRSGFLSETNTKDREYEESLDEHQGYSDTLNEEKEYEATLIDSPGLLPKGHPAGTWFQSTGVFRLVSLVLHALLIAIHLGLLIVWSKNLEHRVVFSIERQRTVSFILTAVTTTVGTTYLAVLVFVTQTLFTRRNLQMKQTVTAIHDSAAAWAGIGSAILHLWRQVAVHGSMFGVLSALLYLGNILALHISTPALFSVVVFNATHDMSVGIEYHMPQGNATGYPSTLQDEGSLFFRDDLTTYMTGSLAYLPLVLGNTTSPGLLEGTLYDVLDSNAGIGNVEVNATGFNVTCHYPSFLNSSYPKPNWYQLYLDPKEPQERVYYFAECQAGMIRPVYTTTGHPEIGYPNLLLYSTIPIVDSSNNHPLVLNLDPPMERRNYMKFV
ncbi:hypothetical protein C8R46DRAFT_1294945 [Mycena filopes]|nr:hypothetical protein C8R46DRAFT_1294945 [Mycena filopes]